MWLNRSFGVSACLLLLVYHVRTQTLKAAIYEHKQIARKTPRETVDKNLADYGEAARRASKEKVDILVFPENGLISFFSDRKSSISVGDTVPDPTKQSWNPCVEDSAKNSVMKNISCLAREFNMYLVVNFYDVHPCSKETDPDCPHDNAYIYNTNTVFDRNGQLIARYHKRHLFFENNDAPPKFEEISFRTEFGTISTFICFDILFKGAVDVVEKSESKIVLYPTWWFDELPYLPAIAVQQGFAIRMNVALLAADMHIVEDPSSVGSGIYNGDKGAVNYTLSEDDKSKLLISDIPAPADSGDSRFSQDIPPHSKYTPMTSPMMPEMKMTKLDKESDTITSCQNGMCCHLDYSLKESAGSNVFREDYYFLVFNGTTDVRGKYKWCTELCLVARCEPDSKGNPCRNSVYVSNTKFKNVRISSNFTTSYVFPFALSSGMGLPAKKNWDYEYTQNSATIGFEDSIDEPLLSFGLHGRCYDRDPPFTP